MILTSLDEALLTSLFDEFNRQDFGNALPRYRFVFKEQQVKDGKVPEGKLHPRDRMYFHPEFGEIWVAQFFKDRHYEKVKQDVDMTLKHEMVHAELLRQGKPWRHGEEGIRPLFNEIAAKVGAYPEVGP